MKVIFLLDDCPPNSFGGAGIVAFEQAREISKLGHQVLLVTTTRNKEEEGRTVFDGMNVEKIYTDYHERWRAYLSLYNFQTVNKIRKILQETSPDIVHAHNIYNWISYWALLLSRKYAKVVCLTSRDGMSIEYGKLHHSIKRRMDGTITYDYKTSLWGQIKTNKLRWNPVRNLIIKYFIAMVDCHIVPSHSLAEGLKQNNIKVSRVLHDGIDLNRFRSRSVDVKNFKKNYLLEDKKVMLFGGRISEAKGAMAALNIFEAVLKEMPNTLLLFVGKKDEYLRQLIMEARERDIGEKIICTGWLQRDLMSVVYESAHVVFVLSKYLDPFPTINLEAMAMMRPVIGTCFGGTSEIVKNGVTGYVVNPDDIRKASRLTLNILSDDKLRHKFGQAGRIMVEQKFDICITGKKLEQQYISLVKASSTLDH